MAGTKTGGAQPACYSLGSTVTELCKHRQAKPRGAPLAVHIMKDGAVQSGARARNPHLASERKEARKEARKVSEGSWEFLKETVPSRSSGHGEKRGIRGTTYPCAAGSTLANFKPLGSQMAGGTRGRLLRATSIEGSQRAGQAPPDSVHASRSCGAWRGDARRARWDLGVRSPKCSGWEDATVCAQTGDRGRASRRKGDCK